MRSALTFASILACGLTACTMKPFREYFPNERPKPKIEWDAIPPVIAGGVPVTLGFTIPTGVKSAELQYASEGKTFRGISGMKVTKRALDWDVPAEDAQGAKLRLKLVDMLGKERFEETRPFDVDASAPKIAIVAPKPNQKFRVGEALTIGWTIAEQHPEAAPISIEYSKDGGVGWKAIAIGQPLSESYAWVPEEPSEHYRVRVSAVDRVGHVGTAMSEGDFVVLPAGTPAKKR